MPPDDQFDEDEFRALAEAYRLGVRTGLPSADQERRLLEVALRFARRAVFQCLDKELRTLRSSTLWRSYGQQVSEDAQVRVLEKTERYARAGRFRKPRRKRPGSAGAGKSRWVDSIPGFFGSMAYSSLVDEIRKCRRWRRDGAGRKRIAGELEALRHAGLEPDRYPGDAAESSAGREADAQLSTVLDTMRRLETDVRELLLCWFRCTDAKMSDCLDITRGAARARVSRARSRATPIVGPRLTPCQRYARTTTNRPSVPAWIRKAYLHCPELNREAKTQDKKRGLAVTGLNGR
jgi:hypothetical protein